MSSITVWFDQYGYIVLFFSLMIELIAIGLPVEILMSYVGLLVFQGKLSWGSSILVAALGSMTGMTIAYWIGRKLGTPFIQKYGHRIHMGPERMEKVSHWFSKYGNKMLVIGYFIRGLRHITAYFSGITKISFRTYAIYAYSGAFLWVGTFISLGKLLGPKWEQFHKSIFKYLIIACIIAVFLFTIVYLYRNNKARIKEWMVTSLRKLTEVKIGLFG